MPEMNTQRRLVGDFRRVMSDAEALLGATRSDAGEEIRELRHKLQSTLSQARHNLLDAQDAVVHKAKHAAYATDDFVHDHSWKMIAGAVGVGLVVGLVLGRR